MPASKQQPGPVIWINGFRSVGKSTIARQLRDLLGEKNATIIQRTDLAEHVKGDDRDAVWASEYSRQVAKCLTEHVFPAEKFSRVIIITECLYQTEIDRPIAEQYQTAARVADKPFIPIYLACDGVKHLLRHKDKTSSGLPLSQNELAQDFLKYQIFRFPNPMGTDLNITTLQPAESARVILRLAGGDEAGIQTEEDGEEDADWVVVKKRTVAQSEL